VLQRLSGSRFDASASNFLSVFSSFLVYLSCCGIILKLHIVKGCAGSSDTNAFPMLTTSVYHDVRNYS